MQNYAKLPTIAGIWSLFFWSATIGICRKLSVDIGLFRTGFYVMLLSGGFSLFYTLVIEGKLQEIFKLSKLHLAVCGFLFVSYMLSLYGAIGFAKSDAVVIEVGVINYFWPALTLLFSAPILKNRLKLIIVPGIIISIVGVFITVMGTNLSVLESLSDRFSNNYWSYILAAIAAISWGLYSNFSRRLANGAKVEVVSLFMLFSAIAFFLCMQIRPEGIRISPSTYPYLFIMVLFPSILAYHFWDLAMKKGNIILVASIAFLTPAISTIISSVILSVTPGWNVWLGSLLLIVGAFVSKRGVVER